MRRGYARKRAGDLRRQITRRLTPWQSALRGIRERYRRIEVCTRDWAEGKNQRHQHCAGGQRIGQKSKREISARKTLSHNPGTDHRGQQEGCPERLSHNTSKHSTPSATAAAASRPE